MHPSIPISKDSNHSNGMLSYPEDGFAFSNEPGYQVSLNMCSDGQGGAYAIWMDVDGKTYASTLFLQLSYVLYVVCL